MKRTLYIHRKHRFNQGKSLELVYTTQSGFDALVPNPHITSLQLLCSNPDESVTLKDVQQLPTKFPNLHIFSMVLMSHVESVPDLHTLPIFSASFDQCMHLERVEGEHLPCTLRSFSANRCPALRRLPSTRMSTALEEMMIEICPLLTDPSIHLSKDTMFVWLDVREAYDAAEILHVHKKPHVDMTIYIPKTNVTKRVVELEPYIHALECIHPHLPSSVIRIIASMCV